MRWRPASGDRVTGELVRIADKTSFGNAAPTLYLLVDDGRYVTVRASGVVLRGALETAKPKPGEQIAIKFEGMKTSAAGRDYAMYRFAVRRDASWWVAA